MNENRHLERSIQPSQRSTRALVAGLDERHGKHQGVQSREWFELRRRVRELLADYARESISAGDVAYNLHAWGLDEPCR